jgi:hypothetical protein
LISFLDEKGRPNIVEKAFVVPPHSQIGPISLQQRQSIMNSSDMKSKYQNLFDRDSAYEQLQKKIDKPIEEKETKSSREKTDSRTRGGRKSDTIMDTVAKTVNSTIGRQVARELVRGLLGSFLRK